MKKRNDPRYGKPGSNEKRRRDQGPSPMAEPPKQRRANGESRQSDPRLSSENEAGRAAVVESQPYGDQSFRGGGHQGIECDACSFEDGVNRPGLKGFGPAENSRGED